MQCLGASAQCFPCFAPWAPTPPSATLNSAPGCSRMFMPGMGVWLFTDCSRNKGRNDVGRARTLCSPPSVPGRFPASSQGPCLAWEQAMVSGPTVMSLSASSVPRWALYSTQRAEVSAGRKGRGSHTRGYSLCPALPVPTALTHAVYPLPVLGKAHTFAWVAHTCGGPSRGPPSSVTSASGGTGQLSAPRPPLPVPLAPVTVNWALVAWGPCGHQVRVTASRRVSKLRSVGQVCSLSPSWFLRSLDGGVMAAELLFTSRPGWGGDGAGGGRLLLVLTGISPRRWGIPKPISNFGQMLFSAARMVNAFQSLASA